MSTRKEAVPEFRWEKASGFPWDYRTSEDRFVATVKHGLRGTRDLSALMFQLSRELNESEGIVRAYLVLKNPGMSLARQNAEWGAGLDLLRPALAGRLALIRIEETGTHVTPEGPETRAAAAALYPLIGETRAQAGKHKSLGSPRSFFDVLKVLVHAWLLRDGPLSIREIEKRTMQMSYPTVAEAVRKLEERGEALRSRDRSVTLDGFPQKSWGELIANADSYRMTTRYADSSGRTPDPDHLVKVLKANPVRRVAIGGVAAARHLYPGLDLVGSPRLDLVSWTGDQPIPQEIARALDVALVPATSGSTVALAIHVLLRPDPRFSPDASSRIQFADPVETLLDLYDLRLVDQAESFVKHMRSKESHALTRP